MVSIYRGMHNVVKDGENIVQTCWLVMDHCRVNIFIYIIKA